MKKAQEETGVSRSKFNVDKDKAKRTCDGIVFDSEMEMKYYRDVLCPKVESGEVVYYELQKPYVLQQKFVRNGKNVQPIMYVADYFIRYKDGTEEVIDIKGCPDSVAILKRKLFWFKYPDIDYKWLSLSKKYGGWQSYEELKKKRSIAKKEKSEKLDEIKEEI